MPETEIADQLRTLQAARIFEQFAVLTVPLGDVAADAGDGERLAARIAHRTGAVVDPAFVASGPQDAVLGIEWCTVQHCRELARHPRAVVGVNRFQPTDRIATRLRARSPEYRCKARADIERRRVVQGQQPERIADGFGDLAQTHLALLQGELRFVTVGDVAYQAGHTARQAVGAALNRGLRVQMQEPPAAQYHTMFKVVMVMAGDGRGDRFCNQRDIVRMQKLGVVYAGQRQRIARQFE